MEEMIKSKDKYLLSFSYETDVKTRSKLQLKGLQASFGIKIYLQIFFKFTFETNGTVDERLLRPIYIHII